VPDDCPLPVREADLTGQARLNLVDGLYEFQRAYGRAPRSWRDYSYGMGHLARAAARESIRLAAAGRMAQAVKPEDWKDWIREQRTHADW
jgi:hypothetical protein